MTHRFLARLHVGLLVLTAAVLARLRYAPERGQGTVEYVALILLVAAVLAAAVAATTSSFNLENIIIGSLKKAISQVGGDMK